MQRCMASRVPVVAFLEQYPTPPQTERAVAPGHEHRRMLACAPDMTHLEGPEHGRRLERRVSGPTARAARCYTESAASTNFGFPPSGSISPTSTSSARSPCTRPIARAAKPPAGIGLRRKGIVVFRHVVVAIRPKGAAG